MSSGYAVQLGIGYFCSVHSFARVGCTHLDDAICQFNFSEIANSGYCKLTYLSTLQKVWIMFGWRLNSMFSMYNIAFIIKRHAKIYRGRGSGLAIMR